ncbi:SWF/SNF helicase family protein, partial [Salipiger manganoxidans]|uniref:C-terminal helicase domain-containing protein n=1 Tax=Salipiger marinus TaxID=555512 RepID=UPI001E3AAF61
NPGHQPICATEPIESTLKAIARFEASGGSDSIVDLEIDEELAEEDDDLSGLSVGKIVKIELADMDIKAWKQELSADQIIIDGLIAEMNRVEPEDDAKLQHLVNEISGKMAEPINPGNRKVIVFTAFADTAKYLYAQLAPHFEDLAGVHTGIVTGTGNPKTTLGKPLDFQSVLTLFSPIAKEKDKILPNEPAELDILIATDCISEGQNLQDCDYLVNYDIHWNPVRIVQRFGRIDRIGSPNTSIQLSNYWPDISLDEYINLKERVENRMHIVDVTGTGEDNVLTAKSSETAYRKEQLQRLQNEVIELEDVKTGISITDLGLNDFRMDLLNYIKENGDLATVPNGLHAVVPSDAKRGLVPGVIFALRNIHDTVNINQQNRLHPYYLVYISENGDVVVDQTQVKRLLDLVRASCKSHPVPVKDLCEAFNAETKDGRSMEKYSALLSDAIRSMIEVKEERDIDSLFAGGHTSALTHTIAGIDDFELIAFIVVRDRL